MTEQPDSGVIPEWTRGWRLQRALDHAGLTVEEMGEFLGVSRQTMSRWLHDRGPIRDIYIKQWALRTGINFRWLKDGVGLDPSPAVPADGANFRKPGFFPGAVIAA